ncbi:hypothetical protein GCM10027511_36270 [Hymenobacter humi]
MREAEGEGCHGGAHVARTFSPRLNGVESSKSRTKSPRYTRLATLGQAPGVRRNLCNDYESAVSWVKAFVTPGY